MKPVAGHHLARAREAILEAEKIAAIPLSGVAARSAYFAAFHAAEALIAERTDRVAKTHAGVRTEFARLTRDRPTTDRPLLSFLAKAYRYKEISDYAAPVVTSVTSVEVDGLIETAKHFVAYVTKLLDAASPSPA